MIFMLKKELRHLFGSLRSFASIGILLLFCGIYTVSQNMIGGSSDFSIALMGAFPATVLLFPLLSSHQFSEERRCHAQGLLYSYSIRPVDVVLGKYFSLLTVLAIPIAVLAFYPFLLSFFGEIRMAHAYFALLGFFLLCASLLALCLFLSLFFKNGWITYALSAGVLLLLYLLQLLIGKSPSAPVFSFVLIELLLVGLCVWLWLAVKSRLAACCVFLLPIGAAILFVLRPLFFSSLFSRLLSRLNPFARYVGFIYGRFDLEGILFYLSFAAFFVALTVITVAYRRDEEL